MPSFTMPRRRLKHETRVLLHAALGPLPAVALALGLLWTGGYSLNLKWTLTIVVLGVWAASTAALRHQGRPDDGKNRGRAREKAHSVDVHRNPHFPAFRTLAGTGMMT